MPEKRNVVPNTMNERPTKNLKNEPARLTVASRSGTVAVAQPITSEKQLAAFEAAMRHFHARRFAEARELFAQAREGPGRDIGQRADLHVRMCARRLEQAAPSLETAEDHYNFAVTQINNRNIAAAQEHLVKALAMEPDSDHVPYAMALASALAGDLESAHNHLRRAIELEPRNRITARQDADFAPFLTHPPLDSLVSPEKKNW
jgi:tetratricopeptide (TPR) repeat protein